MEITGTIVNLLPIQLGRGKKGTWQRQDIILQIGVEAKLICISLWNKLVDEKLMLGDAIKASVTIESREYNSKWYTDIKAWQIECKRSQRMTPEPLEVYRPSNITNKEEKALNPIYSSGVDIEVPF